MDPTLPELLASAKHCEMCGLRKRCNQVVVDPPPATASVKLAIVGEAPGEYEDYQGIPFVGPSGRFLNQMLVQLGLRRDQVYITNAVKCRPVVHPNKNGKPSVSEIQQCQQWLIWELLLCKPQMILALGGIALYTLTGLQNVSAHHGERRVSTIPQLKALGPIVFCTYHPAAVLRQHALVGTLQQDIEVLRLLLNAQQAL